MTFRTARRAVGAAAVLAGLALAGGATADDSKLKVKVGDPFPDVAVPAAQAGKVPGKKAGDKISVADLKGKVVVVAFYPKALTGG
jgi:thioredoxin-dependent peroxiredoxin